MTGLVIHFLSGKVVKAVINEQTVKFHGLPLTFLLCKNFFFQKLLFVLKNKRFRMDIKQIQELVRIITRTSISEIEIEEKDIKIVIRQKADVAVAPQPAFASAPIAPATQQYTVPPTVTPAATPPAQLATPTKAADNLITIKSPMIGTFYRRSSPDKPPFAEVGTEVTVGKTVCIIEAMKLFNEIESEVSGTIVKVLVEDSSPVEYDQPLFLVEP